MLYMVVCNVSNEAGADEHWVEVHANGSDIEKSIAKIHGDVHVVTEKFSALKNYNMLYSQFAEYGDDVYGTHYVVMIFDGKQALPKRKVTL